MRIFHKYSGAGNTFLIVDDRSGEFSQGVIPTLCDEEGVDGLILWRLSETADAQMVYFNRDGSLAEMCGNGLRCFVQFLYDTGLCLPIYCIEVCGKLFKVTLDLMGDPPSIWVHLQQPSVLFWDIELWGHPLFVMDIGVPHAVLFAKGPIDVIQEGRRLRHHPLFAPRGVNVNFVWVESSKEMRVRTYERGVEGETAACGTGSAAAAVVAHRLGLIGERVQVITQSGMCLSVDLTGGVGISGPIQKMTEYRSGC